MDEEIKLAKVDAFILCRRFLTTLDVWEIAGDTCERKDWAQFYRNDSHFEHPFWRNIVSSNSKIDDNLSRPEKRVRKFKHALKRYIISRDNVKDLEQVIAKPTESTTKEPDSFTIFSEDTFGCQRENKKKVYDKAHLLPKGRLICQKWIGVGAAVLGLWAEGDHEMRGHSDHEKFLRKLAMATCGSVEIIQEKSDTTEKTAGQKRNSDGDSKSSIDISRTSQISERAQPVVQRKARTGALHLSNNLMALRDQKILLHGNTPELLIIPCMSLEEAKAWKGEGYKAIALAGLPSMPSNIPQAYINAGHNDIPQGAEVYVPKKYKRDPARNAFISADAGKFIEDNIDSDDALAFENLQEFEKWAKPTKDEQQNLLNQSLNGLVATLKAISYHSKYIDSVYDEIQALMREEQRKRSKMEARERTRRKGGSIVESVLEEADTISSRPQGVGKSEGDEQHGVTDGSDRSETPIDIIVPRPKSGEQSEKERKKLEKKYLRVVFFAGIKENAAGQSEENTADLALRGRDPPPSDKERHPAPDPLLLLAKAAVIWGQMTGVEILANGEEDSFGSWKESYYSIYGSEDVEVPAEIYLGTFE